MKGLLRHDCGDNVAVTSEYLDIFFDMSDDTWYMKIEEPEYDVFESYGVSINYCPLCGAKLTSNNKEVLEAKQRYYEDKLSEIKYHLESLKTIPDESLRTKFNKRTPVVEEAINIATKIYQEISSENEGEK